MNFFFSISTNTFDLDGNVQGFSSPDSDINLLTRRLSRTATLDGDVFIDNLGFTHGDRTLLIRAQLSDNDHNKLVAMIKNYALFTIALSTGAFLGGIQSLDRDAENVSFIRILLSGTT